MRPTRDSGFDTRKRAASPLARLSLLGLAPDGGYLANRITADAGGLLHHRFTLTLPALARRYVSVALSGGLPRPGYYPTSRSLECGLSSALTRQSRDHPTDLAHLYHTQIPMESQAALTIYFRRWRCQNPRMACPAFSQPPKRPVRHPFRRAGTVPAAVWCGATTTVACSANLALHGWRGHRLRTAFVHQMAGQHAEQFLHPQCCLPLHRRRARIHQRLLQPGRRIDLGKA